MSLSYPFSQLAGRVRRALLTPPGDVEGANIRAWYYSTAMIGIVDGGIWTFMSVFLARLGASATMLGLFSSLPGLFALALAIPAGALVDRVRDQVKGFVRLGYLSRLMYLPMILAPFVLPVRYLPLAIVVCWTLKAVPESGGNPLWTAVAGRAVSPARRAHVNGTRWALMSVISAGGQALFGRYLDSAPFPGAFQVVFAVSLAAALLEMLFFSRIRVEPTQPPQRTPSAPVRERARAYLQPLLEHKPFGRYLAATVLYRTALFMPGAILPILWVRELQASNSLIGLRGTVGYAGLVLGYLVWGRRANRIGHRRMLAVCALGVAGYVVGNALAPDALWLLPVAFLWGLTISGSDIALFDLQLHAYPAGQVSRFASVAAVPINLSTFLGPLLGVALANLTNVRTALLANGVLLVVSLAGFVLLPKDV